jgi:hypothetical protein
LPVSRISSSESASSTSSRRARHEVAADGGERHGARGALDQRHAQELFELAQPLRDGRLRDIERAGRRLEAAFVGNGHERLNAEDVDLHQFCESMARINSFYGEGLARQASRQNSNEGPPR